jgi:cytochrome c peroxidase
MNQPPAQLTDTLAKIAQYQALFARAFPHRTITPDAVADAIATYERTLVSAVAPFDAWIAGDDQAISNAAKQGFELFNTKARCALCHSGWRLTDNGFHDIGLPDNDQGRGRLLPAVISMQHAFKTPSLRETAGRAPYMHDGSLPTLQAVVAHYNQAGIDRNSRSPLVMPLNLSPEEQNAIVAFLLTLTSNVKPGILAALPR